MEPLGRKICTRAAAGDLPTEAPGQRNRVVVGFGWAAVMSTSITTVYRPLSFRTLLPPAGDDRGRLGARHGVPLRPFGVGMRNELWAPP